MLKTLMPVHDIYKLNSNTKYTNTALNTVISPNFLVWNFFGKAQFPQSFGRFCGSCAFPLNFHTCKSGETTVFLRREKQIRLSSKKLRTGRLINLHLTESYITKDIIIMLISLFETAITRLIHWNNLRICTNNTFL